MGRLTDRLLGQHQKIALDSNVLIYVIERVAPPRGRARRGCPRDIAGDTVVIQAVRGMSLADAVHLATARAAGATAFVTNDRRIRGSTKIAVV